MPKATTCFLSGREINIVAAVTMRAGAPAIKFDCVECGGRVRAHKKGTTGQSAHFEHVVRNSRCSRSDPR